MLINKEEKGYVGLKLALMAHNESGRGVICLEKERAQAFQKGARPICFTNYFLGFVKVCFTWENSGFVITAPSSSSFRSFLFFSRAKASRTMSLLAQPPAPSSISSSPQGFLRQQLNKVAIFISISLGFYVLHVMISRSDVMLLLFVIEVVERK